MDFFPFEYVVYVCRREISFLLNDLGVDKNGLKHKVD